jgi:CheY-like chemotaxis protein
MGQEIFSILLVDDEKNERKGIEKLIQKNGYPLEIFQAENCLKTHCTYKKNYIRRHYFP